MAIKAARTTALAIGEPDLAPTFGNLSGLPITVPSDEVRNTVEGSFRLDREYAWYSEDHWKLAAETYAAIVSAAKARDLRLVKTLGTALDELYDRDRALAASRFFSDREPPVSAIPSSKVVRQQTLYLDAKPLTHWTTDIPLFALANVAHLVQRLVPDELVLASYSIRQLPKPDPVIYARFGGWYVRIAEWD
jgi:hypothetical protein